MTVEEPTVSVVIPAYNAASFLPEAVASIRQQCVGGVEIIIVDDGSTDDTAVIAESQGADVTCIRRANGGPAQARNTGLAAARGAVLTFLDADDLWPAGSLSVLLSKLADRPEIDVVLGQTQVLMLQAAAAGEAAWFEPFGEPWHGPQVGSGVYRRRILDTVGVFDASLAQSEDLDWFVRMRERDVPTLRIADITLLYRLHGSNLTRGSGQAARQMFLAIKRSMDRRRVEAGEVRALERATDARAGRQARRE